MADKDKQQKIIKEIYKGLLANNSSESEKLKLDNFTNVDGLMINTDNKSVVTCTIESMLNQNPKKPKKILKPLKEYVKKFPESLKITDNNIYPKLLKQNISEARLDNINIEIFTLLVKTNIESLFWNSSKTRYTDIPKDDRQNPLWTIQSVAPNNPIILKIIKDHLKKDRTKISYDKLELLKIALDNTKTSESNDYKRYKEKLFKIIDERQKKLKKNHDNEKDLLHPEYINIEYLLINGKTKQEKREEEKKAEEREHLSRLRKAEKREKLKERQKAETIAKQQKREKEINTKKDAADLKPKATNTSVVDINEETKTHNAPAPKVETSKNITPEDKLIDDKTIRKIKFMQIKHKRIKAEIKTRDITNKLYNDFVLNLKTNIISKNISNFHKNKKESILKRVAKKIWPLSYYYRNKTNKKIEQDNKAAEDISAEINNLISSLNQYQNIDSIEKVKVLRGCIYHNKSKLENKKYVNLNLIQNLGLLEQQFIETEKQIYEKCGNADINNNNENNPEINVNSNNECENEYNDYIIGEGHLWSISKPNWDLNNELFEVLDTNARLINLAPADYLKQTKSKKETDLEVAAILFKQKNNKFPDKKDINTISQSANLTQAQKEHLNKTVEKLSAKFNKPK